MSLFKRDGDRRSAQRAQTFVEFALVAPIFFAVLFGIFSLCTYVVEVQVANDAAQAAARWGVMTANFAGTPPAIQCPDSPAPLGMIEAAQNGAGPWAGSMTGATVQDLPADPEPSLSSETYGCQITVTIPYFSFGGYFDLGPRVITATAVDYVE